MLAMIVPSLVSKVLRLMHTALMDLSTDYVFAQDDGDETIPEGSECSFILRAVRGIRNQRICS
jgi:hypothetical protein